MENPKTRIFIADVRSLSKPYRLAAALKAVSTERQKKAQRLKTPAARARSVGAEVLLKKALAQSYGIQEPLVIKRGSDGKPWLADYPGIFFNLSHSGAYVVCGLGSDSIGVDIQKMSHPKLRLAKRFFAPSEADWLLALPKEQQQQAFYDLWALKEAYMKYTGKGFNLPMDAFTVKPDDPVSGLASPTIYQNERKISARIKSYSGLADYVIWAVTERGDFQEELVWIDL